jgi:magnesium chelatase family protein
MTTGIAWGSVLVGLTPTPVRVSAHANPDPRGKFTIDGLPEIAAREARVRVAAATGVHVSAEQQSVSVHVDNFPASGGADALDLAIAVAVLRATGGKLDGGVASDESTAFVGALTLSGELRPVRGALCHLDGPAVAFVVPAGNAWEAGLGVRIGGARVYEAATLADLAGPLAFVAPPWIAPHLPHGRDELPESLQPIFDACRSLPRVLLVGPVGCGALMVARRLATQAPALQGEAALEVVRIYGRAGLIGDSPLSRRPPFRAPHHTVSEAGLIGGGENVRPGEVSLAHRGVLVLDELPEFRRGTLQALASTLREKTATFSRSRSIVRIPAAPLAVVGTATLCPPGSNHGERVRFEERLQELATLMGMRRIDIPALSAADLAKRGTA